MALCVKVIIDDIVSKIDKHYTYCVDDPMAGHIIVGGRVIVPFSRNNIDKKAIVISKFESDNVDGLKSVLKIIDKSPVLNLLQLDMVSYLKEHCFVTYYTAAKAMIPRGIDFKFSEHYTLASDNTDEFKSKYEKLSHFFENSQLVQKKIIPATLQNQLNDAITEGFLQRTIKHVNNIGDLTDKYLTFTGKNEELEQTIQKLSPRAQKQRDLLGLFYDNTQIELKEALYYSGCSISTIKILLKKGLLRLSYKERLRNPYKNFLRQQNKEQVCLNDEQKIVFEGIKAKDGFAVHLVHGVTGSGKTKLYITLIDNIISKNKSALFLIPEISLTPQMLEQFYLRYGDCVAVIHSGLSMGERTDEWKRIMKNEVSVVVGTRSAIFSPVKNLGIIIMDEEHESSYKAENPPKYHAKELARLLCYKNNIPLVLGSATPSIESYYQAHKGKYNLYKLTKRFNDAPLPQTDIIDMRDEYNKSGHSFLSTELSNAISDNLQNKKQTILFLNRRGAHTLVGCAACGYIAKCPECTISLTFHTANKRCMCHYCGYSIEMFSACPECGNESIKKLGVGTQLIADKLELLFPNSRILRMDHDTISSYLSYGDKLNAFREGKYDILLGTQMVAKGLDFPNVTLVGVINADLSLYIDDFRANERTFSLLTQVTGRSGRADMPGRAIIQTYSPDNEIIEYAREQNYESFFDYEIKFRKAINYPPFCDILLMTIYGTNQQETYNGMMRLYKFINKLSKSEFSDIPLRLLAPRLPRIVKVNQKYRYNLIIKCKNSVKLRKLISICIDNMEQNKYLQLSVDINPINYF